MEKTSTFSPVVVESVERNQFSGKLQARISSVETIISVYGIKNGASSLDSQIFSTKDFGEGETHKNESKRVFFLSVPETMDTIEKVQEHLKKFPNLHLFRILSNKPILSDEDLASIKNGKLTLDTKANNQVVRDNGGKIVPFGDKPQYKRICLSTEFREDEDLRDSGDAYTSPEIWEEMHPKTEEVAS